MGRFHNLTTMFKKNSFQWIEEAITSFGNFKQAVMHAPMLQLPNFFKVLVLECDALGSGGGAVLFQDGHTLSFFSKALLERIRSFSAYEKELLALVLSVESGNNIYWDPSLRFTRIIKA